MNTLLAMIAILGFSALAVSYFLSAKPQHIANLLRMSGPIVMGAAGIILSMTGRFSIGIPLVIFAISIGLRSINRSGVKRAPGQKSTVRSASLEMMLDHETGAMNGVVLAGTFEGAVLDDLDEEALMTLAAETADDEESAQLLEAYLDRRIPNWREDFDADPGTRSTGPANAGAMTEQEAYQILGLEPGATVAEIRKAHRGLMQRVHPDVGGSAFLAQRINEAKDFLMRTHSE